MSQESLLAAATNPTFLAWHPKVHERSIFLTEWRLLEIVMVSTHFFSVCVRLATLGAYRVFPCTGTAKDDVIIAAMERAYADGMDVVNLSLGGGSAWAYTPLSKAAGQLAHLGVIVVAASGNDGELGIEEVSSPSINENVISVASYEGSGYLANYFQVEGVTDVRIGEYEKSPNCCDDD